MGREGAGPWSGKEGLHHRREGAREGTFPWFQLSHRPPFRPLHQPTSVNGAVLVQHHISRCLTGCLFSQSSLRGENATVFACLNHGVPLASEENSTVTCETGKGRATPSSPALGQAAGPVGLRGAEPGTGAALPLHHLLHFHCRVAGGVPSLYPCQGPPRPPADPLPTDRELVPEPALALHHGQGVRPVGGL